MKFVYTRTGGRYGRISDFHNPEYKGYGLGTYGTPGSGDGFSRGFGCGSQDAQGYAETDPRFVCYKGFGSGVMCGKAHMFQMPGGWDSGSGMKFQGSGDNTGS